MPQIATSNHLLEGDVIWFARPGWTRDLARAAVAHDAAEAEALLAEAKGYPHETVGVELIDVTLRDGLPAPTHFREAFRTRGPSNRFHGRQADHV